MQRPPELERLVDQQAAPGSAEGRLARLVTSSAPVSVSDGVKQRCLTEVLEQSQTPRGSAALLRPAIVTAVLLAAGVTAATTLGRARLGRRSPPVVPAPLAAPPPHPAPSSRPAPEAPAAEAPAPSDRASAPRESARPAARTAHVRPARGGEDPARVVAAIKALRKDHDPERASALLAEYRRIYPHGALAEEALALSIEAAAAGRNHAAAAAFAQQYLAGYPAGRFRRTAEQALARPKP